MSNPQPNSNTELDDGAQEAQQQSQSKRHSKNFYRRRIGNDRRNQDLGEDENRAPNDDDEHSDENNKQDHNRRGRGLRGGFRMLRGRGRAHRAIPFYGDFHAPYHTYASENGGYFALPEGYYGQPYYNGAGNLPEQDGSNNHPTRGNRGSRGGRRRGPTVKNENTEKVEENQQQTNNNEKKNKRRNSNRHRRRPQSTNGNASGTEQQTDGAVTDDQQQHENNTGASGQRSNRRRPRKTHASQSGPETEERSKPTQTPKPKDDETIVKNVLRTIVNKVVRRAAPRNRRHSRANTKEGVENPTDLEQTQGTNNRRRGRGRRGGQPGNGYFIEQGYYDPYGMTPYYYRVYYDYGGQDFGGQSRGRGGRGRGRRFRHRGGANKENQPHEKTVEGQLQDLNLNKGKNPSSKATISEQVNQSSTAGDARQE